jgi:putative endonuclease
MYYVYLLRSRTDNKIYTGFTTDLRRRIKEHFTGQVHSTLRFHNLNLIYYEAYISKEDAIQREKYLKSTKGERTIKLVMKNTLAPIV